jgi:hypothetical protein
MLGPTPLTAGKQRAFQLPAWSPRTLKRVWHWGFAGNSSRIFTWNSSWFKRRMRLSSISEKQQPKSCIRLLNYYKGLFYQAEIWKWHNTAGWWWKSYSPLGLLWYTSSSFYLVFYRGSEEDALWQTGKYGILEFQLCSRRWGCNHRLSVLFTYSRRVIA